VKYAFLFLFLVSFALADIGPTTSQAEMIITMSRDISADGIVKYANFTTYDFPQAEGQQVSLLAGGGFGMPVDDYGNIKLIHKWEETDELGYEFKVSVRTDSVPPLSALPSSLDIPSDIRPFLSQQDYTLSTQAMEAQVNEIVRDAQNPFEEAVRIGNWVNSNIEYDISYGAVILDAPQVFKQRRGTCDEFAHLFISMVRSIGIPARYVSGVVYGTLGIDEEGSLDWYNHGWAEVWLGEWVPFDPTYGQFGFVDGSHVRFASVPSQKDLDARLEWIPNTVKLDVGELEYTIDVLETANFSEPLQTLEIEPIGEVDEAESISVKAKVTGGDACVGTKVRLVHHEDFTGSNLEQLVITCPGEQKDLEWTLQGPEDLEEGYSYSYEVIISNGHSEIREPVVFNKPRFIPSGGSTQGGDDPISQFINFLLDFLESLLAQLNL